MSKYSPRDAMREVSRLLDNCTPEDNTKTRPKVAAVITKSDGQFVQSAYRGEISPGEHAEYTLLHRKINDETDLSDCIAYVSLEPCSLRGHNKIPCSQRLVSSGIKTVYIANIDPNPHIRGNGIQWLLRNGIDVRFFDSDISKEIHNKNREFMDEYYSENLYKIKEFAKNNKNRTLDEWLISINKIYHDRNFAFPLSTIFMHLSESVGDLAYIVSSDKEVKEKNYDKAFIKCIAWWLALCDKASIESVETLLYLKFPEICPYCQLAQHDRKICKSTPETSVINWDRNLEKFHNITRTGKNIDAWADHFLAIYRKADSSSPPINKLVEEMGELAEACRYISEHKGYFWSEAADVFAWLMSIHNQQIGDLPHGAVLAEAISIYYPDSCRDCGQIKCGCPLLLKSDVSRLSEESPPDSMLNTIRLT